MWRVALANERLPRLTIHRGYEQMIQQAGASHAGYLRGRLQEARWLLKNLAQRGENQLKVVPFMVRPKSGFLVGSVARRVGKHGVSTCQSRGLRNHKKKK